MQKLKSEKGFSTADGAIAVVIITISVVLIASLVYNTYVQVLATHRNSIATLYAVEVLEKVNKLAYSSNDLKEGVKNSDPGSILGVAILDNYRVELKIQDYNKMPGNTNKRDLIKIITVAVSYMENNIQKNISMKTLKINM